MDAISYNIRTNCNIMYIQSIEKQSGGYMKKVIKILSVMERNIIKLISIFSTKYYMKYYIRYLKKIGVKINGTPNFIHKSVYFDGSDYSKISIGENTTISCDVMLLTHDGSINTVSKSLELSDNKVLQEKLLNEKSMIVKGIKIGKNSFIGAKSSILPGAEIGDNVIIGAGSVVRGIVPNNSIVIGNPSQIIGNTDEYLQKKIDNHKNI